MAKDRTQDPLAPRPLDAWLLDPSRARVSVSWVHADSRSFRIELSCANLGPWRSLAQQLDSREPDMPSALDSYCSYLGEMFGAGRVQPSQLNAPLRFVLDARADPKLQAKFPERLAQFFRDLGFEVDESPAPTMPRHDAWSFLRALLAFDESELATAAAAKPGSAEGVAAASRVLFGAPGNRALRPDQIAARARLASRLAGSLDRIDEARRGAGRDPAQWQLDLLCSSLARLTVPPDLSIAGETSMGGDWQFNALGVLALLAPLCPPKALLRVDGREPTRRVAKLAKHQIDPAKGWGAGADALDALVNPEMFDERLSFDSAAFCSLMEAMLPEGCCDAARAGRAFASLLEVAKLGHYHAALDDAELARCVAALSRAGGGLRLDEAGEQAAAKLDPKMRAARAQLDAAVMRAELAVDGAPAARGAARL